MVCGMRLLLGFELTQGEGKGDRHGSFGGWGMSLPGVQSTCPASSRRQRRALICPSVCSSSLRQWAGQSINKQNFVQRANAGYFGVLKKKKKNKKEKERKRSLGLQIQLRRQNTYIVKTTSWHSLPPFFLTSGLLKRSMFYKHCKWSSCCWKGPKRGGGSSVRRVIILVAFLEEAREARTKMKEKTGTS